MSSLPNGGFISSTASICLFVSFLVLQCLVSMQVNGLPFGVVDTNPLTLNFRHAINNTLRIPVIKRDSSKDVIIEFHNPTKCYSGGRFPSAQDAFYFSLGDESCIVKFRFRKNMFIYHFAYRFPVEDMPIRLKLLENKKAKLQENFFQPELYLRDEEFCSPVFEPNTKIMYITLWKATRPRVWPECDVLITLVGDWLVVKHNNFTPFTIFLIIEPILLAIVAVLVVAYSVYKTSAKQKTIDDRSKSKTKKIEKHKDSKVPDYYLYYEVSTKRTLTI